MTVSSAWTAPRASRPGNPRLCREARAPAETRVRVGKSKSLNPAGKPLTVVAWVKAEKPTGVIVARGGFALGYVLYLEGGRPHFTVRSGAKLGTAAAKDGRTLSDRALPAPSVFDGMIAARGGPYLSTTDGKVLRLRGRQ